LSETSTMALLQLQNGLDLTNEDAAIIKNKILSDPNQNSPEKWYDRGRGQSDLNNYQNAVEYFINAIEQDPDYSAAYFELGECYHKLGDFTSAIENFTKAITFNNKWETGSNLALAYYYRARSFSAMKPKDETKARNFLLLSLDDWNKSIELNPQESNAYYGRGLVNENLNNLPEAIRDFEKSVELDSSSESMRINASRLIRCYSILQNREKTEEWLALFNQNKQDHALVTK
jgi:tetratricopeptide (TPR) repeat protein